MEKLFDIRSNYTEISQGFNSLLTGDSLILSPNASIDVKSLNGAYPNLTPIKNILFELNRLGEKRFYLQRTFSLGDVLTLVPVVKRLREEGFKPYIRTFDKYRELMGYLGVETEDIREPTEGYGIILDWLVERDRVDENLKFMHRLFIHAKAIGLKDVESIEWDWDCDLSKFPELDFGNLGFDKSQYIVFHGRGTQEIRSLAPEAIEYFIKTMNKDGIKVVHIGESIELTGIDESMTRLEFMTSSLPELVSWIAGAKCLVAMDSAPLWISHFTKTPTILLLGPSRPQERISLHPLYPEGAVPIRLNDYLNCESCIESAKACEKRIDCLRQEPSEMYKFIRSELLRFWEA